MTYHRPPDDYVPPTHCEECGGAIILGPVMGGTIWKHLEISAPGEHGHVAKVGRWWDTSTGEWREGSGLEELLRRAAENRIAPGTTYLSRMDP